MSASQKNQTQTMPSSASSSREQGVTFDSQLQPGQDVVEYLKAYARERPDVAALWCFGIGFVLGWKIKPW